MQSKCVAHNILSRQFHSYSAAACASFLQYCQTSSGVFNVTVIGIEFQINQAHASYCTKIAPPAHFEEIEIQLQIAISLLVFTAGQ